MDFSFISRLTQMFSIMVSAGIEQCWKPRSPDPSHCSCKSVFEYFHLLENLFITNTVFWSTVSKSINTHTTDK